MAANPSTSEVRLRDVTEDDLPIFFEHQRDPDASAMAAFTPRDRDAFMAHWNKIMADESNVLKTVLFGEHVAGNVVSWEDSGAREIGYWIGKEHWGKGVATSALSQFVGLTKARPLYAHVAAHNLASIRVLEKCGFAVVGEAGAPPDVGDDGVEEFLMKLET